jgi:hypothetical protein
MNLTDTTERVKCGTVHHIIEGAKYIYVHHQQHSLLTLFSQHFYFSGQINGKTIAVMYNG